MKQHPVFFEESEIYQEHFLGRDLRYPKLAIIETSSLCNLRCPMCPRTIDRSPSGSLFRNMKFELLERLETVFPKLDEVILSWIGEPLINKQLPEIIKFIKQFGPRVHVTTNAVLLTESRIHELIDSGLDSLAVSIDAADPETFAQIRVGTDLETVQNNVQLLNRIKKERGVDNPSIGIAFVAMAENIAELPEMIRLVAELETPSLSIDIVDDFTLTDDFRLDSQKTVGRQEEAREALRECIERAVLENVKLVFPSMRLFHELGEWPEGNPVDDRYFSMDYKPEQTAQMGFRKGCGVPWAHVVIGHDGNVHPCCISGTVLGNVYEQSFDEIWYGPTYTDFRRQLKSTDPPEECWNCRRTIWNGSRESSKLPSEIKVGQDEFYGLGWGPMAHDRFGRAFRPLDREATLFLAYGGEPVLTLELGPSKWVELEGTVYVNDQKLRDFKVFPGWHKLFFRLPRYSGSSVKVRIVTDTPKGQLIFKGASLRRLDRSLIEDRCKNLFWRTYNRIRVSLQGNPSSA